MLDAVAQRYGVLPTDVLEADYDNVRVYRLATEME
jgi:hypothetical protein